jgi:hypothetical protein
MILLLARQEMEHQGLVTNPLTAVGGAPTLGHRRFPYATPLYGHVMALEPFSVPALQKFVCFERPEEIDPADAFCTAPPVHDHPYTTVSELYARIKTVLVAMAARTPHLFIGPLDAQVTGGQLGTDFPRIGALGAGYDVFMRPVTDLQSALGVIDLVVDRARARRSTTRSRTTAASSTSSRPSSTPASSPPVPWWPIPCAIGTSTTPRW